MLPLPVRDALQSARSSARRVRGQFAPTYPRKVGLDAIAATAGSALGLPRTEVASLFNRYATFERSRRYMERFGNRDTLTLEEAFLTYAVIRMMRPQVVVEIGTQTGKSTRKLLDMRELLDYRYEVECFDIYDGVKYFDKTEARLNLQDVTGSVRETILQGWDSGVIFLDARPRELIEDVVEAVLQDRSNRWSLVMHDCGVGLCNPSMRDIAPSSITSLTGVWERHVLAAKFCVPDPLSDKLTGSLSRGHRLTIAPTRHGFGVVMPINLAG